MRLVASMVVRNEMDRYLPRCIDELREFCDEIRVLDDGSTDGTSDYLRGTTGVYVLDNGGPPYAEDKLAASRALHEWTLVAEPTFILAVDADEFVTDGIRLREVCAAALAERAVLGLRMVEVWDRSGAMYPGSWAARVDDRWRPHHVPIIYHVPEDSAPMAWDDVYTGRVPRWVREAPFVTTDIDILHLGWSNPAERRQRQFWHAGDEHDPEHVESIARPPKLIPYPPFTRAVA
jgi:glycosyltransferase involved in cell wall biosynthesis